MLNGYLAVGRRCAVCLKDLRLPLLDGVILEQLELKGYKQIEVDLNSLAAFCITRSEYRRGARIELAPEVVDCSSLVKWLYAQRGIWIPRHSLHQREFGERVGTSELQSWDLVFTKGSQPYYWDDPTDGVGHVGIVTDCGKVLHAANAKVHVIEVELLDFVGKNNFRGATRIIKPGTVTLESVSGRRAEHSLDYRCYILQTLSL